jgi:hypothetical protein
MKCIVHTETQEIVRVSDDQALALTSTGEFKYTTKSKWRAAGRKYA